MDINNIKSSGSFDMGHVSYLIIDDRYLSSASISSIYADKITWDFNRLIVHPKMRGKGYASLLIGKVVEFCKHHKLLLRCGISPYGGLDFQQLKNFYIRHGFQETEYEDFVVLNFSDTAVFDITN